MPLNPRSVLTTLIPSTVVPRFAFFGAGAQAGEVFVGAVGTSEDTSVFGARTEVHCNRCAGHLGHVFTDGAQPTSLRYRRDGVALTSRAA